MHLPVYIYHILPKIRVLSFFYSQPFLHSFIVSGGQNLITFGEVPPFLSSSAIKNGKKLLPIISSGFIFPFYFFCSRIPVLPLIYLSLFKLKYKLVPPANLLLPLIMASAVSPFFFLAKLFNKLSSTVRSLNLVFPIRFGKFFVLAILVTTALPTFYIPRIIPFVVLLYYKLPTIFAISMSSETVLQ